MSDLCRSCKAPVRWVVMARTGRRMPLDPEPIENGHINLLDDGRAEVLRAEDVAFAQAEGTPLYRSHFSSCEHAASHRKARA